MYLYIYTCMNIHIYVFLCIHMYICMYLHVHIFIYMHNYKYNYTRKILTKKCIKRFWNDLRFILLSFQRLFLPLILPVILFCEIHFLDISKFYSRYFVVNQGVGIAQKVHKLDKLTLSCLKICCAVLAMQDCSFPYFVKEHEVICFNAPSW